VSPARFTIVPGGRDPEILRAEEEVARAREAATAKLLALQHELGRVLEWREWIRKRPLVAVAAAFGAGVLLGNWHGALHRNHR
jgi:hypothetical protein